MFLRLDILTRQEDDPARIATLKRKGWVEFTPEVVPDTPPEDAPAWAFRAALRIDNLLDTVNTSIATLPTNRRIVAQERIAGSDSILRRSPLIRYLNENMPELNRAKLDALFVTANEIASGKVGA